VNQEAQSGFSGQERTPKEPGDREMALRGMDPVDPKGSEAPCQSAQ